MPKTAIIESIRLKAELLISENSKLRAQVQKLNQKKEKLQADRRQLESQVAALEKRINVLETKEAMAGPATDEKRARARINRLMREVDKCIALLNR